MDFGSVPGLFGLLIATFLTQVSAAKQETHACSIEGLQGQLNSYALQLLSFFEQFEVRVATAGQIVERTDQNIILPGAATRRFKDTTRACVSDCATEDAFWQNLEGKTSDQVKAHHDSGYWVDVDPARVEELYVTSWSKDYALDWDKIYNALSNGTPAFMYATPARNGFVKRKPLANLTQLCKEQGLDSCLESSDVKTCPAWCRTPELFNNDYRIYQEMVTQPLTEYVQVVSKTYAGSAYAWYWGGSESLFSRYWPSLHQFGGANTGTFLGGDFAFPKIHLQGPVYNPEKGVAWSPPYIDAGSGNLMVTASQPVYVAGHWIGGFNVDITMFQTAPLLAAFTGTPNGFSILCDPEGTVVGAADTTYSALFCPGDSSCDGAVYNIAQSWDPAMSHVKGALGPRLTVSNFDAFAEGGLLSKNIREQPSGVMTASLGNKGSYYIAWTTLENARLLGGAKLLLCVPKDDIDLAARVGVHPTIIRLLDEERKGTFTLSNTGRLAWQWVASSAESNGTEVLLEPRQGTLMQGESINVSLERSGAGQAKVLIESVGNYSACFVPTTVYLEKKDPPAEESDLIHILAAILGVVGGLLMMAAIFCGIRWVVKQHRDKIRLEQEAHEMQEKILQEKLSAGLDSVKLLGFPMSLISAAHFCALELAELMTLHEGIRNVGKLVILDSVELIRQFTQLDHTILFFSYQWLSWDTPGPNAIQLECMKTALKKVAASRNAKSIHNLYVWLDILSIPQCHPLSKAAAVNSLYIYASLADLMVIVCPDSQHNNTKERAGAESYKQRVWCRAEQMAHLCHHGTETMFVSTADNFDDLPKGWMDTVSRVFAGDMTCCRLGHKGGATCDKQSLLPVMLALYFDLYVQHVSGKKHGNFDLLWGMISEDKDNIFPSHVEYTTESKGVETHELFGSMINRVETFVNRDVKRAQQMNVTGVQEGSMAHATAHSNESTVLVPRCSAADMKRRHV